LVRQTISKRFAQSANKKDLPVYPDPDKTNIDVLSPC
jgi:hypothetical protein